VRSGEAWPGCVSEVIPVRATTLSSSRGSSLLKRGELVSDRLVRFPRASWQEIGRLAQ